MPVLCSAVCELKVKVAPKAVFIILPFKGIFMVIGLFSAEILEIAE